MKNSKLTTFRILLIISAIYFVIFIFPNLTGAQNENMLSVFEHDEFAQYPHVIRMLSTADSPYQTLRNFIVYLHYYYGYPFYFFSAISILPIKFFIGNNWNENTMLIMVVLRQLINVLPILISAFLLVWIQTNYKSKLKSILLFILLLSVPAVIDNNMWWHPDSILTLFCVLTIFFLIRDDFCLGKNFFYSGIACGLAIGSKILGVLFVFTYVVYILIALTNRTKSFKKVVLRSVFFLFILVGTVVVSNPLLLLPIERSEIIATFLTNLKQNTVGFWVMGNSNQSMFTQLMDSLKKYYGIWPILVLSNASMLIGFIHKESRKVSIIILTWLIGYVGYFLFFANTMRPHYLIPVILPLFSCLAIIIPGNFLVKNSNPQYTSKKSMWLQIGSIIVVLFVLFQILINFVKSTDEIMKVVNRENTSLNLQMFKMADEKVLSKISLNRITRIYRDWRAYVAPNPGYEIIYNWDLANYSYIEQINPDVLFLEYDNMLYFSDPEKLESAINPELLGKMIEFYSDAINARIKGYSLALNTSFGSVFVKTELFEEFLQ